MVQPLDIVGAIDVRGIEPSAGRMLRLRLTRSLRTELGFLFVSGVFVQVARGKLSERARRLFFVACRRRVAARRNLAGKARALAPSRLSVHGEPCRPMVSHRDRPLIRHFRM